MLNRNFLVGCGVGGSRTKKRHWRLLFTKTNGGGTGLEVTVAGIEMRGSAGGANLCSGGTPSASSTGIGLVSSAFDGDGGTYWESNGAVPQWLAYDFGSPVDVQQVWIGEGWISNALWPGEFDLQYSDDGINWDTLKSFTASWSGATGSYTETKSFDA